MTESENPAGPGRVAALAREVEEFVASGGWDQQPQLFALVPTADILREQPELADQLDQDSEFTPVAQDALPDGDLAEALGRIAWPEAVHGCALAQEIIVLPPDAESELPDLAGAEGDVSTEDLDRLRQAAADHPRRTEARIVAAVLREGTASCVMRLRGGAPGSDDPDAPDELVESPDLAPNLIEALRATLQP
ncbi:PPA1309 family protein [Saccharomonospora sp. NB11]|uniref:PPA1309 family protein n=1 Tax=Saccharomonospora sp. NB11 TaxID=1642298 RepID=UPI0018D0BADA|nr:PPA1309 family protein [Saccharomonospora sp. NB11]